MIFFMGCGAYRHSNSVMSGEPAVGTAAIPLSPEGSQGAKSSDQDRYYYYLSAQRHIVDGDLDRAILDLQKVIDLDPDNAFLKRELAMDYLQSQNSDAALEVIKNLMARNPEDPETLFLYARTMEVLDHKEEAKAAYEKLISSDPKQETPFLRLGDLYLEDNDLDNAYRVYSSLLEHFPDSYAGHFFIGKIYAVRKEYDKAEYHILKTLELVPGLEEPKYELADIYKKEGKNQKVVDTYREILDHDPKNILASLELAVLYKKNGLAAQSETLLKKLGSESYNDPDLFRIVGQEFLDQDRFQSAVTILEGMLKYAPEKSGLSYLLGIALASSGEKVKAVEQFKQVGESSRFFLRASIQASLLYQELGQLDTAIGYIKRIIEKHPNDPDLYLYAGLFYEEKGSFEDSAQALREGLRLNQKNVQLNFRLGVIYDKLGEKKQSIEQMKKVIRLDPKNVNALNYLGFTYAEMNTNLDEAEQLIRTALENKPDDGYITDSLGWIYFKKGKFDQAAIYLEKAIRLVPDDPTILEHLGDVYLKLNQTQKALEFYKRSLSMKKEDKTGIEDKIRSLLEQGR